MIDIVANKEKFLTILRGEVHREGIEDLINWLETTDFFEAPFTGQYTLSCKGGLTEHSIDTYRAATELLAKYRERNPLYLLDLEETATQEEVAAAQAEVDESVALISLLHEVCRTDCWIEDTRNVKNPQTGKWESVPYYKWDEKLIYPHGPKSVYILSQFMRLYVEESQAIAFHEGKESDDQTAMSFAAVYESSPLSALLGIAVQEAKYILDVQSWSQHRPQ